MTAYNALDLAHWDLCFILQKLKEQVSTKTYKRLLISSDRPILEVASVTNYLENTPIERGARLLDILLKAKQILGLHNNEFQELEDNASNKDINYAFEIPNGGFLSIACEIECLHIHGEEVWTVISYKDNYADFVRNCQFDLYSSQEFARKCAALINVITAFYSEDEILYMGKKFTPQSSNPINHKLMEKEEQYLATLYHKTKSNPEKGADPNGIALAIGLNITELPAFQYQLQESEHIRKHQGSGYFSITGDGMRIAKDVLNRYQVTIVTVIGGHAVPIDGELVFGYLYFYRLSTQAAEEGNKSIMVGISDIAQMGWTLSFLPGGSAETLLLLYARDRIIEKINDGTLTDFEKFNIMQQDLNHLPRYTISDGAGMKDAEFYVYKKVRDSQPTLSFHDLADMIIQTRQAINIIFKKKHKEELLSFTQEGNLGDLYKLAQTKEDFNTRVISLGSTVGEMNIKLLRTLTGITDTNIRSIQLLKSILIPLAPGVEAHIKTFQNLASVRNGYPAHKDNPDTLKAYAALGLTYPITDFSGSWKILLLHYLTALQGIKEVMEKHYL